MSDNALASIIVPVYKAERYLDECLCSLTNQTYADLEIILVDDGSPDRCPQICDEWAQKDARISVIHKPNGGPSDARNSGIQAATGQWLLFIDADDAIPTHYVETLVQEASCDSVLVASGVERFQSIVPDIHAAGTHIQKCGKQLAAVRGGLYCWGTLYSTEIVRSIHLQFDKSIRNLEDVVWNGIYLRYISEVVYVDVPYYYRVNPTSITSQCGNYQWQIASWIAARRSILNWFEGKELTNAQKKEIAGMYRHCQNNIYAECVAGDVPYETLRELEKEEAKFCESWVKPIERLARRLFPRGYFGIYTWMLRVKRRLSK